MDIRKIIVAAALAVASFGASAHEWTTSIGVSIGGPNGHITIGTTYGHPVVHGVYVQPGVVIAPPAVVYPAYVPPVIAVPCYNCGRYPQGDPRDPYRNHRHLQRPQFHYHYHYHR